jgi:hypothetical protein
VTKRKEGGIKLGLGIEPLRELLELLLAAEDGRVGGDPIDATGSSGNSSIKADLGDAGLIEDSRKT